MGTEKINGMNGMHENGSQNQEFDLKRIFFALIRQMVLDCVGLDH
jgi:hypothetical protein